MSGGRTGVIYAAAGPDPYKAELYEIRLGPRLCARRLTLRGRILEVTASPEMLIVSNARHLIGDRIELFRDGRFQAVPGLGRGRPYGVGPSLAPDGRTLAVIRISGPMNRIKRIVAVPMGSPGPARRLFVSRSLRQLPADLAWGPRGPARLPVRQSQGAGSPRRGPRRAGASHRPSASLAARGRVVPEPIPGPLRRSRSARD